MTQMSVADSTTIYRFHEHVVRFHRAHTVVLVSKKDGTSVRVSQGAVELLPLLAEGADSETLTARLRALYPQARNPGSKLKLFLAQLAQAGLLDNLTEKPRIKPSARKIVLGNPDPIAKKVADALLLFPAWLRLCFTVSFIAAACAGIGTLFLDKNSLPHPMRLFDSFSLWGLLAFIFLIVPLHEFAHAIACRMAGVPVGPAGILFHGIMPGPYVDTGFFYQIREKYQRFRVPAAGPFIDLMAAGTAAWLLVILDSSAFTPALVTLFLLSMAFVYLDTNPLAPSDGSRMLEALLDDELARRSALSRKRSGLSYWKSVWLYRGAIALHLLISGLFIWYWWTHSVRELIVSAN